MTKTALLASWRLRKSGGRNRASQASPVETGQSCMLWHMSGTTSAKSGRRLAARSRESAAERHDVPHPRGPRQDAAEVEKRNVTLDVAPRGRARPACSRQALRVRLPGTALCLERVGQTDTTGRAARAVVGDPLGRAGDQREVVRQARMRHAAVSGQHRVAPGERVEGRRGRAAEDRAAHLVLEHDHDHVVEGGDGSRRRLRPRECRSRQSGGQHEHHAAHDDWLSARSSRFFQKWKPTRASAASTTSATPPIRP